MDDPCLINGAWHKYFCYQVKSDFEPVVVPNPDNVQLYQRVEYAILTCNCGSSIKRKVVQDEHDS